MRMNARRIGSQALLALLLVAVVAFFAAPVLMNLLTSLKSDVDISSSPPKWFFIPGAGHYRNVLAGSSFPAYLLNSVIIGMASAALAIAITFPAAYSVVRSGKLGDAVLGTVLILRLMPAMGMAIPVFVIFTYLHLVDTRIAIILMHTLFICPTALLLLTGYMAALPVSLEEAAFIDGANLPQLLTQILFPIMKPGLASVAILGFLGSWNEFLFSVIVGFKKAVTATVGTSFFITAYSVKWGDMAAAITVSTIPTILFIFVAQKHLITGMTAGAVK